MGTYTGDLVTTHMSAHMHSLLAYHFHLMLLTNYVLGLVLDPGRPGPKVRKLLSVPCAVDQCMCADGF